MVASSCARAYLRLRLLAAGAACTGVRVPYRPYWPVLQTAACYGSVTRFDNLSLGGLDFRWNFKLKLDVL